MPSNPPESSEIRAAILSPLFSHSRARPWCRAMVVTVYHRAPHSPTGVLSAGGWAEQDFEAVLAELRTEGIAPAWAAPLSPTEGL